jgi:hypothetical protein
MLRFIAGAVASCFLMLGCDSFDSDPDCKKGCKCGNTCISCSKTCRQANDEPCAH